MVKSQLLSSSLGLKPRLHIWIGGSEPKDGTVTRSPAVRDVADLMAMASPPQRERGVGAGQARATDACDDIRGRVRRYSLWQR